MSGKREVRELNDAFGRVEDEVKVKNPINDSSAASSQAVATAENRKSVRNPEKLASISSALGSLGLASAGFEFFEAGDKIPSKAGDKMPSEESANDSTCFAVELGDRSQAKEHQKQQMKSFECEKNCGFRGSFDDVTVHEANCQGVSTSDINISLKDSSRSSVTTTKSSHYNRNESCSEGPYGKYEENYDDKAATEILQHSAHAPTLGLVSGTSIGRYKNVGHFKVDFLMPEHDQLVAARVLSGFISLLRALYPFLVAAMLNMQFESMATHGRTRPAASLLLVAMCGLLDAFVSHMLLLIMNAAGSRFRQRINEALDTLPLPNLSGEDGSLNKELAKRVRRARDELRKSANFCKDYFFEFELQEQNGLIGTALSLIAISIFGSTLMLVFATLTLVAQIAFVGLYAYLVVRPHMRTLAEHMGDLHSSCNGEKRKGDGGWRRGQEVEPGAWQEVTDANTSRLYYYNTVTGETSWVPPPGFTAESMENCDAFSGNDSSAHEEKHMHRSRDHHARHHAIATNMDKAHATMLLTLNVTCIACFIAFWGLAIDFEKESGMTAPDGGDSGVIFSVFYYIYALIHLATFNQARTDQALTTVHVSKIRGALESHQPAKDLAGRTKSPEEWEDHDAVMFRHLETLSIPLGSNARSCVVTIVGLLVVAVLTVLLIPSVRTEIFCHEAHDLGCLVAEGDFPGTGGPNDDVQCGALHVEQVFSFRHMCAYGGSMLELFDRCGVQCLDVIQASNGLSLPTGTSTLRVTLRSDVDIDGPVGSAGAAQRTWRGKYIWDPG